MSVNFVHCSSVSARCSVKHNFLHTIIQYFVLISTSLFPFPFQLVVMISYSHFYGNNNSHENLIPTEIPIPMHTSIRYRSEQRGQHARGQCLGTAQRAAGAVQPGCGQSPAPSPRRADHCVSRRQRSLPGYAADCSSGVVDRRPGRLLVADSLERLMTVAWRCHAS